VTAYALMTGQTVPSNASDGPAPTPVAIDGKPKRGRLTFSLAGSNDAFAEASVWAQTAITPYGYTQDIQLAVMSIGPGQPNSVSQELLLNMAYYDFLFAQLNLIDRSQKVAASLSLVV
jgi:hypothetical protein